MGGILPQNPKMSRGKALPIGIPKESLQIINNEAITFLCRKIREKNIDGAENFAGGFTPECAIFS
jgi:hypothetical protein